MKVDLTDTDASKIAGALVRARRAAGSPAMGMVLTLVVVTLAGSIWVMYHMDQNMMPMSPHEALTRP